jgi:tetratricopeptide (TPR) repeat protein
MNPSAVSQSGPGAAGILRKNFRIFFFSFFFLFQWTGTVFPDGGPAAAGDSIYREALLLQQTGRLHEAESKLRRAIALDPSNADYHFDLANVLALRYDALSETARRHTGWHLLGQAGRELEQAVMYRPDFLAARFNLGVVYKRLGFYEKAREVFREVLRKEPRQVNALLQIGATYEEQGFFEEAKTVYLEARELAYTDPGIQAAIEEMAARARQPPERVSDDIFSRQGFAGGFPYSEGSQAENFYRSTYSARAADQNIQQVLPYLGAWLYEQFMKVRRGADD